MHRILLREVVVDAPSETFAATRDFWAAARFHLDIETDDEDAEVARLIRLGAVKVAEGRTWVVMRDPSGLLFDVVPHESPWFAERAREVR